MVAMPEEEEIMCDSSEKDMEQLEKEMGTKIGLDGGVLSTWASAMGGSRRGKQGDAIVGGEFSFANAHAVEIRPLASDLPECRFDFLTFWCASGIASHLSFSS
jgi:hypothetical protein